MTYLFLEGVRHAGCLPCHRTFQHDENLCQLTDIDRIDVADMQHVSRLFRYQCRSTGRALSSISRCLTISGIFSKDAQWA